MSQLTKVEANKEIKEGKKVVCYAQVQLTYFGRTVCSSIEELNRASKDLKGLTKGNIDGKSKVAYFSEIN